MLIHYDKIPERDERTDRRTEGQIDLLSRVSADPR